MVQSGIKQMHLLTLMLGIVLLPKVYALRCHKCSPKSSGSCEATVMDCNPLKHECGSLKFTSFVGDLKLTEIPMKTCILADECDENSINFGSSRMVISSKCCSSDLCNTEPAPEPGQSILNGKKCFTCQGEQCTDTLNCKDNEGYCISKTVMKDGKKTVLKGCASKHICSKGIDPQIKAAIGGEIRCCEGNLCNGANSIHAGFLLLLAPLVSLLVCS